MSSISRRDFLNGIALTVAAGLTPAAQIAAEPTRYPPALTGLRGQHPGSYEVAHAQAWQGKVFALEGLPVEEDYDLVVVGGGISGLAAAFFYRRAAGRGNRRRLAPARQWKTTIRIRRRFSDLVREQGAAARSLRQRTRSARRQDRARETGNNEADELPRLPCPRVRLQRRSGELFSGPHARLLRAWMRRRAGRRRPRVGLPGLRRLGPAGPLRTGALHLSLPRRQRFARSAFGAFARPGSCARRAHGRRGAGAFRLR